jgi:DUF438 domain-containing protein
MAKSRANANKSSDAIAMLKADHDKVKKLFKEFERMHDAESEEEAEHLATQICNELTIHATLEEEIFYPEVRAAINDEELIDEAEVEHATAKELIAQIESAHFGDDKFAAKVCVLGEYINHHIKEEQDEMFPKAKRAKVDMTALGERMAARKEELKAEMGMMDEDDAEQGASAMPPKKGRTGRSAHTSRG